MVSKQEVDSFLIISSSPYSPISFREEWIEQLFSQRKTPRNYMGDDVDDAGDCLWADEWPDGSSDGRTLAMDTFWRRQGPQIGKGN